MSFEKISGICLLLLAVSCGSKSDRRDGSLFTVASDDLAEAVINEKDATQLENAQAAAETKEIGTDFTEVMPPPNGEKVITEVFKPSDLKPTYDLQGVNRDFVIPFLDQPLQIDPGSLVFSELVLAFSKTSTIFAVPQKTDTSVQLGSLTLEIKNQTAEVMYSKSVSNTSGFNFQYTFPAPGKFPFTLYGTTADGRIVKPFTGSVLVVDGSIQPSLIVDVSDQGARCGTDVSSSSSSRASLLVQVCLPEPLLTVDTFCIKGPYSQIEAATAIQTAPSKTDSCWASASGESTWKSFPSGANPFIRRVTLNSKNQGQNYFVTYTESNGKTYSGLTLVELLSSTYPTVYLTKPLASEYTKSRAPGETLTLKWNVQDNETALRDISSMVILVNKQSGEETVVGCSGNYLSLWPICPSELRGKISTDEVAFERELKVQLPANWVSTNPYYFLITEIDSQGQSMVVRSPELQSGFEVVAGQQVSIGSSGKSFLIENQKYYGSFLYSNSLGEMLFAFGDRYLKLRSSDNRLCRFLRSANSTPSVFDCEDITVVDVATWNMVAGRQWTWLKDRIYYVVPPDRRSVVKFDLGTGAIETVISLDTDDNLGWVRTDGTNVFYVSENAVFRIEGKTGVQILGARTPKSMRGGEFCNGFRKPKLATSQLEIQLPCISDGLAAFAVSNDGRVILSAVNSGGQFDAQYIVSGLSMRRPETTNVNLYYISGSGFSTDHQNFLDSSVSYDALKGAFVSNIAYYGIASMKLPQSGSAGDVATGYKWERFSASDPSLGSGLWTDMAISGADSSELYVMNYSPGYIVKVKYTVDNSGKLLVNQKEFLVDDSSVREQKARLVDQAFSSQIDRPIQLAGSKLSKDLFFSDINGSLYRLQTADALSNVTIVERSFEMYPMFYENASGVDHLISIKNSRSAQSLAKNATIPTGENYSLVKYVVEPSGFLTAIGLQISQEKYNVVSPWTNRELAVPHPHKTDGLRADFVQMNWDPNLYGVGRGGPVYKTLVGFISMPFSSLSSSAPQDFIWTVQGISPKGQKTFGMLDEAEKNKFNLPDKEADFGNRTVTYWSKNGSGAIYLSSTDYIYNGVWSGYGFGSNVGATAYSNNYEKMYGCRNISQDSLSPTGKQFVAYTLSRNSATESKAFPFDAVEVFNDEPSRRVSISCYERQTQFRNQNGSVYLFANVGDVPGLFKMIDDQSETSNTVFFRRLQVEGKFPPDLHKNIGSFVLIDDYIYYTYWATNQVLRNKLLEN